MSGCAVVTGASRGIGAAITARLLDEGYRVLGTCRDSAHLGPMAADRSGAFVPMVVDVRDDAHVERLVAEVERSFGRLDLLVNNAGVMEANRLEALSASAWDDTLAVNLRGPFVVSRALLPLLRKGDHACIVNIAGRLGTFEGGMEGGGFVAYRVSKAAVNALTLALAKDLASDGIRVVSVDPIWVRTDMGGPDAPRDAAVVAREVVEAARSGLSGVLLREGVPVAW